MKKIFFFLLGLVIMSSCSVEFEDLQYAENNEILYVYKDGVPFTGTVATGDGRIKMVVENGQNVGTEFYNKRGQLSFIYYSRKKRTFLDSTGQVIDRATFFHLFSKDMEEMKDFLYYFDGIIKNHNVPLEVWEGIAKSQISAL